MSQYLTHRRGCNGRRDHPLHEPSVLEGMCGVLIPPWNTVRAECDTLPGVQNLYSLQVFLRALVSPSTHVVESADIRPGRAQVELLVVTGWAVVEAADEGPEVENEGSESRHTARIKKKTSCHHKFPSHCWWRASVVVAGLPQCLLGPLMLVCHGHHSNLGQWWKKK